MLGGGGHLLGDCGDLHGDGVDLLGDGGNLLSDGGDLLGDGGNLLSDGGDLLGDGGNRRATKDWKSESVTDQPTNQLTWVGAGDTCVSKKTKFLGPNKWF